MQLTHNDQNELNISTVKLEFCIEPRFLKVHRAHIPSGKKNSITWEFIERKESVHGIVLNLDTKELLMVSQVRVPVFINSQGKIKNTLEMCAGLCDKDLKSVEHIMQEEIEEELGYKISVDLLVKIDTLLEGTGISGSKAHLFYAEVYEQHKVSEGGGINNENITVVRIPFKDVSKLLDNEKGNIDVVTMLLLHYLLRTKSHYFKVFQ